MKELHKRSRNSKYKKKHKEIYFFQKIENLPLISELQKTKFVHILHSTPVPRNPQYPFGFLCKYCW